MTLKELFEEIEIEQEMIGEVVKELTTLQKKVGRANPTVIEKTAASAFLPQFFNGIENILKRICRYHVVPLPTGDIWHLELFKLFCEPATPPLPVLFNHNLAYSLAPYRKFRHIVHHGYGFQIDWQRMRVGIENVEEIFCQIKNTISSYLQTLKTD